MHAQIAVCMGHRLLLAVLAMLLAAPPFSCAASPAAAVVSANQPAVNISVITGYDPVAFTLTGPAGVYAYVEEDWGVRANCTAILNTTQANVTCLPLTITLASLQCVGVSCGCLSLASPARLSVALSANDTKSFIHTGSRPALVPYSATLTSNCTTARSLRVVRGARRLAACTLQNNMESPGSVNASAFAASLCTFDTYIITASPTTQYALAPGVTVTVYITLLGVRIFNLTTPLTIMNGIAAVVVIILVVNLLLILCCCCCPKWRYWKCVRRIKWRELCKRKSPAAAPAKTFAASGLAFKAVVGKWRRQGGSPSPMSKSARLSPTASPSSPTLKSGKSATPLFSATLNKLKAVSKMSLQRMYTPTTGSAGTPVFASRTPVASLAVPPMKAVMQRATPAIDWALEAALEPETPSPPVVKRARLVDTMRRFGLSPVTMAARIARGGTLAAAVSPRLTDRLLPASEPRAKEAATNTEDRRPKLKGAWITDPLTKAVQKKDKTTRLVHAQDKLRTVAESKYARIMADVTALKARRKEEEDFRQECATEVAAQQALAAAMAESSSSLLESKRELEHSIVKHQKASVLAKSRANLESEFHAQVDAALRVFSQQKSEATNLAEFESAARSHTEIRMRCNDESVEVAHELAAADAVATELAHKRLLSANANRSVAEVKLAKELQNKVDLMAKRAEQQKSTHLAEVTMTRTIAELEAHAKALREEARQLRLALKAALDEEDAEQRALEARQDTLRTNTEHRVTAELKAKDDRTVLFATRRRHKLFTSLRNEEEEARALHQERARLERLCNEEAILTLAAERAAAAAALSRARIEEERETVARTRVKAEHMALQDVIAKDKALAKAMKLSEPQLLSACELVCTLDDSSVPADVLDLLIAHFSLTSKQQEELLNRKPRDDVFQWVNSLIALQEGSEVEVPDDRVTLSLYEREDEEEWMTPRRGSQRHFRSERDATIISPSSSVMVSVRGGSTPTPKGVKTPMGRSNRRVRPERGPMWGTGNANLDALLGDLLAEDGGESPEYESEDEVEEEEDEEEEEEEEAVPLERLKPNSKFLSRLMKSTERTNARIADEDAMGDAPASSKSGVVTNSYVKRRRHGLQLLNQIAEKYDLCVRVFPSVGHDDPLPPSLCSTCGSALAPPSATPVPTDPSASLLSVLLPSRDIPPPLPSPKHGHKATEAPHAHTRAQTTVQRSAIQLVRAIAKAAATSPRAKAAKKSEEKVQGKEELAGEATAAAEEEEAEGAAAEPRHGVFASVLATLSPLVNKAPRAPVVLNKPKHKAPIHALLAAAGCVTAGAGVATPYGAKASPVLRAGVPPASNKPPVITARSSKSPVVTAGGSSKSPVIAAAKPAVKPPVVLGSKAAAKAAPAPFAVATDTPTASPKAAITLGRKGKLGGDVSTVEKKAPLVVGTKAKAAPPPQAPQPKPALVLPTKKSVVEEGVPSHKRPAVPGEGGAAKKPKAQENAALLSALKSIGVLTK